MPAAPTAPGAGDRRIVSISAPNRYSRLACDIITTLCRRYDLEAMMRVKTSWTLWALCVLGALSACAQVTETPTPLPTSTAVLDVVQLVTSTPEPTSTVVPLPTEPPPTPTPTATPIVYQVQSGDTLLGIALQYGVTVDALQLANPTLRPELLQIGQQVFIPAGAAGEGGQLSAPALLPSPTPIPLELSDLACFETPVGGLLCLGEVYNLTQEMVENVQVAVELYDVDGKLAAHQSSWVARDMIPAGETSAFGVLFESPPAEVGAQRALLQSGEAVTREGNWYLDLAAVDHQGGFAGSVYRVTGAVENTGAGPAAQVTVYVTLYDEDGVVTGFRQLAVTDRLEPGAGVPFDVRLSPAGPGTQDYAVAVSGFLVRE